LSKLNEAGSISNLGLLLRSQIIRPQHTFTLRSLALQIHLKGRLYGSSMLWIFTRQEKDMGVEFGEGRPVCIIKKLPDSQRLFCIFGVMNEKQMIDEEDIHNQSLLFNQTIGALDLNKVEFKFYKN
jgi:hypothetical protein